MAAHCPSYRAEMGGIQRIRGCRQRASPVCSRHSRGHPTTDTSLATGAAACGFCVAGDGVGRTGGGVRPPCPPELGHAGLPPHRIPY